MAKQTKKITPTSRKRLARVERENLQKRAITIGFIVIGVLVIAIAAFGIIKEGFVDPQKPVITVGDTEITYAQFGARARYQRYQLLTQYGNYYNFMQSFGDENTRSLIESNLRQIQFQLEPAFLGATVLDDIVADILIKQEAETRGITVSAEEVDTFIAENFFLYYPNGTPTPVPTQAINPTSTLSPLQLTLVPQEPTATPSDEIGQPTPTTEAEDTGEPAPTAELPTATPYTEDAYQAQYEQYLDYIDTYAKISEADLRWIIEADIYQTKLMDALSVDIETEEEQVWARHILVAEEAEALTALERLEAGEDFATLAGELSTDTGSASLGGDLGWFGKNQMVGPFDNAAFDLEIGEISKPVESSFGWHIIQVLGHEVRQITNERLEVIRNQIFQDWLTETRANADIVIDENWGDDVPTEPAIPDYMLLP